MPDDPATPDEAKFNGSNTKKRARQPVSDPRYPRKRSLKACHVCRARKTKCDNVQPTCGFCASLNIPCSYDATDKDHSAFDPASLEILKQLSQISSSQDHLLQIVQSVASSQAQHALVDNLSPSAATRAAPARAIETVGWEEAASTPAQQHMAVSDWLGQTDSASTTPAASTGVAAVRWFGLLANDVSHEAIQEAEGPLGVEGGFLDAREEQGEEHTTPLQRATRMIDGQPSAQDLQAEVTSPPTSAAQQGLWQAAENIHLLEKEQRLFENFLHRICPWLDLFDPGRTFSTRVPHLAVRNAGLLNAILALSCYHQSLDNGISKHDELAQNAALQYYYQTLHYVQKAMRYTTYQNSHELMATTLIVSTYEMLRNSRRDWQQHLQGVFWILRSRQIEVETASLESTTWWAWLRQDIWAAFRDKRRTYSTWVPKKGYAELSSHELASRSVWILAQVVNYCAVDSTDDESESNLAGRIGWAKALKKMLDEWESRLTVEFSPLPAYSRNESEVFKPQLIHPQCYGLAMQVHHVSRILVMAHEPSVGRLDAFMHRQKAIQRSTDMVCGIGMTLTEDASSVLSSQCLFIAGMFIQSPRKRSAVLQMLDCCRQKCGWPTPSLSSELKEIWADPNYLWGSLDSRT